MGQIAKTYIAVFLMILFTAVGAGVIIASMNASNAEKYNADCVTAIEQHAFSDSIIEACKTKAAKDGYTLDVTKLDTNNDGYTDMCECVLYYKYSIPFLNSEGKDHFARAYAR